MPALRCNRWLLAAGLLIGMPTLAWPSGGQAPRASLAVTTAQVTANLENGEYQTEISGISHWYKIAGAEHKTVPLIIVHGGPGGNVYNFERTAGLGLEKFSTVVYYEQRGSGRSAIPKDKNDYSIPILVADLEELRQKLGLTRVNLLGFSFGGELALEYALAHPESVERLILQCPTVDWEQINDVQNYGFQAISTSGEAERIRAAIRTIESPQERNAKVWSMVDSSTIDRFLFHNQDFASLNRRMWNESKLSNNGLMFQALAKQRLLSTERLIDRARLEEAPTLIMVGLHDRNVGVNLMRDLAVIIPDSKLVLFENSAHFPDIEETDKYVDTIRVFVTDKK